MRIVGGALSGRIFSGPGGDRTRPTSERVREGMFSALEARGVVEGARVLDAYAGTAALAFEALSRGASSAVSVERDARSVKAIVSDARALGLAGRHEALAADLERAIGRLGTAPFDLIFCDPPWADLSRAVLVLRRLSEHLLAPSGRVVLVHAARDAHPALGSDALPLAIDADYRYGDTAVVIYGAAPSQEEPPAEGTPDDDDHHDEAKAT